MGLKQKLKRDRRILLSLAWTVIYCILAAVTLLVIHNFFSEVKGEIVFYVYLPAMLNFAITGTIKKYYHDKGEIDYSEKSYSSSNNIEDFVLKNNNKK